LIKKYLKPGDAIYFSHGFSIVYKDQTKIIPPKNVDVYHGRAERFRDIAAAHFLSGEGINASFAVFHDASGRAAERTMALGVGIGAGYLFPTTFEKEVFSDLVGERGVLMGALAGIMEAQYEHCESMVIHPAKLSTKPWRINREPYPSRQRERYGLDVFQLLGNCAARCLDWKPKFKKAVLPVFKELYERVASGAETARVIRSCAGLTIKSNSAKNCRKWVTLKCGRQEKPPGHYVRSGRERVPPKRQRRVPAAENQINHQLH